MSNSYNSAYRRLRKAEERKEGDVRLKKKLKIALANENAGHRPRENPVCRGVSRLITIYTTMSRERRALSPISAPHRADFTGVRFVEIMRICVTVNAYEEDRGETGKKKSSL